MERPKIARVIAGAMTLVLTLVSFGVISIATAPAANAATVCTYVSTGDRVGTLINGSIRNASSNATHRATRWSTWSSDSTCDRTHPGGQYDLRRLRLTTPSTGGCQSSVTTSDTWVWFNQLGQRYSWSTLSNGQCFRMQSRAANSAATGNQYYGQLRY